MNGSSDQIKGKLKKNNQSISAGSIKQVTKIKAINCIVFEEEIINVECLRRLVVVAWWDPTFVILC